MNARFADSVVLQYITITMSLTLILFQILDDPLGKLSVSEYIISIDTWQHLTNYLLVSWQKYVSLHMVEK